MQRSNIPQGGLTLEDDPVIQDEGGLTLQDAGVQEAPVQGAIATNRAAKNHLALGAASPGIPALESNILVGQELDTQILAAQSKTAQNKKDLEEKIRRLAISGQVTPEQAQAAVIASRQVAAVDPSTALEQGYADNYLNMIVRSNQSTDGIMAQAVQADPDGTRQAVIGATRVVAGRDIATRVLEDAQAKYQKQGWGEFGWNMAKTMVPFNSAVTMSPDWSPGNIALTGDVLAAERDKYWSLVGQDLGQAKAWLQGRVAGIAASNPILAVHYAEKMVSMSRDERFSQNIFSAMDVQMGTSVAASVGKAGMIAAGLRGLLKGGTDAVADGTIKMDQVFAGLGDLRQAAQIRAARQIYAEGDPLAKGAELKEMLPSLFNIDIMFAGQNAGALARERAQSLVSTLKSSASQGMDAVLKVPRAQRVEETQLPGMLDRAAELIQLQRPSINDGVLDKRIVLNTNTNTRDAELIIGKRDGTLFRSAAQAQNYADREYGLAHESFRLSNNPPEAIATAHREATAGDKLANKVGLYQGKFTPEHVRTTLRSNEQQLTKLAPDSTQIPVLEKAIQGQKAYLDGLSTAAKSTTTVEALYKKKFTPEQVQNMLTGNKQNAANIKLTISDPIEAKRDPAKVSHLKGQLSTLEPEIKAQEKFLAGVAKLKNTGVSQAKLDQTFINQQGNGWYISITKPLNETDDVVRGGQVSTTNKNPVTLMNWLIGGKVRSAEDQLSPFQRGNRKIALHSVQEVQRVFVEMAEVIKDLPKASRDALNKVLIANRDYVDHSTGLRGRAYRTQSQLEKAWFEAHGTMPTENERVAYLRYHQIMDLDWVMRNFGVHRDLARQGVELYSTVINGEKASFPGRFEKSIPWGSKDDMGILVVEDGAVKHHWARQLGAGEKDQIDRMVSEKGYQILMVANPEDRPLKTFAGTGNEVNFMLVKNHEVKPLPMNLVDYNPGVHVLYPQEHFSKQPIIERSGSAAAKGQLVHFGDKTIFSHVTEKEAQRVSTAMGELQKMFRNQATDAQLNAFIEKNLPEDAEFWRGMFYGRNGQEPFLSLEHPIGNTHSGRDFFDTHPDLRPTDMRSSRNSEHNLFRAIDMDFLANRNGPLETVTKTTNQQAIYKLELAETLDPYVSINRALGNSIRNLYLNDYKTGAIEQWVAQYAHLMDDPAKAMNNPYQTFYGEPYNRSHTDRAEMASAQNTHERILQFIGIRSELGKDLNLLQQKLLNSMGEAGATRAIWHGNHELKFLKNPIAFTRAAMFDARFGFFNPGQFIVQGMGAAHVLAVAGPLHWEKGMSAYALQRWMAQTENADVINHMANIATKFGWKKADFIESYRAMRNSGVDIIGKEHALRDEAFDPNLFTSKFRSFLEWGRYPFKEGERFARVVAWNTAYTEWRKLNPTKTLDNFDMGKILNRFDDLAGNMTKASNSAIQEGLMSIPSHFYTFSHRMMEQFWGGRLTPTEKMRAFATHSLLFGIPVAASIPLLYPVYEEYKQTLLQQGSPLLDNPIHKVATEGFLSYIVAMVTGKEFNIEQRYGPGAPDLIKKFIDKELTFPEAVGGATGGFVSNLIKSTYPFRGSLWVGLTGGQEEFPLVKEDFWGLLREISSVNNFHNAFYAMNTGKYISRSGSLLHEGMDAKDAVAIAFGLTPKAVAENRLMIGGLKEQADAQKIVATRAELEIKRAIEAFADNNDKKAETHFARAKSLMVVIGDFKEEMIGETYQRAISENRTLVDRIELQFTQKGYKSQLPARFQRLLEKRN